MSANLIGWGCDLQQKLDAMDRRLRRTRWAGYVAIELYGIAQGLQKVSEHVRADQATPRDHRRERNYMEQARRAVQELGFGIEVYRLPDPRGWPLYVVFPGDVPKGSGPEAVFEKGVAVPPRP